MIKIKKILSKNYNGSFTVEAAIIYPFSIIIILSMILLSFYLHDLVICHSALIKNGYGKTVFLSCNYEEKNINETIIKNINSESTLPGNYNLFIKHIDNSINYNLTANYHISFNNINNICSPKFLPGAPDFSINIRGSNLCRRINFYKSITD